MAVVDVLGVVAIVVVAGVLLLSLKPSERHKHTRFVDKLHRVRDRVAFPLQTQQGHPITIVTARPQDKPKRSGAKQNHAPGVNLYPSVRTHRGGLYTHLDGETSFIFPSIGSICMLLTTRP